MHLMCCFQLTVTSWKCLDKRNSLHLRILLLLAVLDLWSTSGCGCPLFSLPGMAVLPTVLTSYARSNIIFILFVFISPRVLYHSAIVNSVFFCKGMFIFLIQSIIPFCTMCMFLRNDSCESYFAKIQKMSVRGADFFEWTSDYMSTILIFKQLGF